jgi:hypothetical protein
MEQRYGSKFVVTLSSLLALTSTVQVSMPFTATTMKVPALGSVFQVSSVDVRAGRSIKCNKGMQRRDGARVMDAMFDTVSAVRVRLRETGMKSILRVFKP